MPKKVTEMSAVEVRRLSNRGYHAVGGVAGLYLQVAKGGSRSWVLRASVGGKRRDIGLGGFPDVTVSQARESARLARAQIREGRDPVAERRAAQQALANAHAKRMTFAEATRRKHAAIVSEFRHARDSKGWLSMVERYAFPIIGTMEVAEIELPHVLAVLEPIWHDKPPTARKLRQRMETILSWATVSGYREGTNPAAWKGNLSEVLPKPAKIHRAKHHRALDWPDVPDFLAALAKRGGMAARALEFAILTAARSGEVRLATWEEIDFDASLWTVPGERTKTGRPHRVPLSADAVAVLKAVPRLKDEPTIFAAPQGGPLSDMSISKVCRAMKVDAVPHGFRSSFKDWCRTNSTMSDEVSELALAHVNSDATRAAYARDELIDQRRELMNQWAAFLYPRSGDKVVPMSGGSHA